MKWSKVSTYILPIIKVVNFSPIYLFLMRVYKISVTNKMINLLERQDKFNLFYSNNNNKWRLMWTTSSDFNSLTFDIVNTTNDKAKLMNWNLPFP